MRVNWSEIEKIVQVAKSNVILLGGPSLGKSYVAQNLGGYAITIHEGTAADEIRGHFVPQEGGFAWHDGIGMKGWREGVPLVVNEIDKGSDEVKSILHVIADNPETAKITLPTNETLRPKAGFRIIATMNGNLDDLPDALRSRFPIRLLVDEPHPNAVRKLPEDLRDAAFRTATARDVDRRILLRTWYAYAELRDLIGGELALKAVFGERYEEVYDALTLSGGKSLK
jgi:MoxR-like ATPase